MADYTTAVRNFLERLRLRASSTFAGGEGEREKFAGNVASTKLAFERIAIERCHQRRSWPALPNTRRRYRRDLIRILNHANVFPHRDPGVRPLSPENDGGTCYLLGTRKAEVRLTKDFEVNRV